MTKEELIGLSKTEAKAITSCLDEIRESIIRTKQRAATNVHLEHRIWEIWGYVRNNQNQMDSEKACKLIKTIIDEAVADVQKRVEDLSIELEKATKQIATHKKEIAKVAILEAKAKTKQPKTTDAT